MSTFCSGLGSSFGFTGFSSFSGLVTGTVTFSLPTSSTFRAGWGVLLPPPPPPPPGPGCCSQTATMVGALSIRRCWTLGRVPIQTSSATTITCTAADTPAPSHHRPLSGAEAGLSERKRALGLSPGGRSGIPKFRGSGIDAVNAIVARSEEHTSELQSPDHLVCRLLLEKKK